MSDMTSRERIMAAYHLEEPDRVPIGFFTTEEWVKSGDRAIVDLVMKESDVTFLVDIAGMDGCRIYLGDAPLKSERFSQGGHEYVRYSLETPKGSLHSTVRIFPEHFGGEWKIEPFVKDEKDFERFLSLPYRPLKPDPKPYLEWKRRLGERGVVHLVIPVPIYLPAFLMRVDTFLVDCARKPDAIFQIEDIALQYLVDYIDYLSRVGVDVFLLTGAELLSATMAHPRNYEKYVLPYDRKVVEAVHSFDGIAHTHMHGKVGVLLDKIAATGVDALNPLEPPPRGDIDLGEAKRRVGNKLCLCGNVDELDLARRNSQEVADMCKKSIQDGGPGGGYVMMATGYLGGVYPPIPLENVEVLIRTVRHCGKYLRHA